MPEPERTLSASSGTARPGSVRQRSAVARAGVDIVRDRFAFSMRACRAAEPASPRTAEHQGPPWRLDLQMHIRPVCVLHGHFGAEFAQQSV